MSLLKYFAYEHLPEDLRRLSKQFFYLATSLQANLPDGSEKTVAIRKLLEAKDAAVRSQAVDGEN